MWCGVRPVVWCEACGVVWGMWCGVKHVVWWKKCGVVRTYSQCCCILQTRQPCVIVYIRDVTGTSFFAVLLAAHTRTHAVVCMIRSICHIQSRKHWFEGHLHWICEHKCPRVFDTDNLERMNDIAIVPAPAMTSCWSIARVFSMIYGSSPLSLYHVYTVVIHHTPLSPQGEWFSSVQRGLDYHTTTARCVYMRHCIYWRWRQSAVLRVYSLIYRSRPLSLYHVYTMVVQYTPLSPQGEWFLYLWCTTRCRLPHRHCSLCIHAACAYTESLANALRLYGGRAVQSMLNSVYREFTWWWWWWLLLLLSKVV